MKLYFKDNLIKLASALPAPIYAVGGYVRNFLINKSLSDDIDLCGQLTAEEMANYLEEFGFYVVASYKRTGTVVFSDGEQKYEYTVTRSEKYLGGEHSPSETTFGVSIEKDALRRDFKCNAIYYDVKRGDIIDPLNGISDVKNKILDTVTSPEKVFCFDGLRLMRLARLAGELNFKPTKEVIDGAKRFADNIKDISAERINDELKKILISDGKYSFSNPNGHYDGLKILDEIGVLDIILPELTLGRNMQQRKDFHKYDVLEHSLRTVLYSEKKVRISALLHDVGKPKAFMEKGKYHGHASYGTPIARKILKRLKFDTKTINEVCFLVENHMQDMEGNMKESKVRRFIVTNYGYLDKLFCLMQADFMAGLDKTEKCPQVIKWQKIYEKMKLDGTPFDKKDLKITAKDLLSLGFCGEEIGKTLDELFYLAVISPEKNDYDKLIAICKKRKEII